MLPLPPPPEPEPTKCANPLCYKTIEPEKGVPDLCDDCFTALEPVLDKYAADTMRELSDGLEGFSEFTKNVLAVVSVCWHVHTMPAMLMRNEKLLISVPIAYKEFIKADHLHVWKPAPVKYAHLVILMIPIPKSGLCWRRIIRCSESLNWVQTHLSFT